MFWDSRPEYDCPAISKSSVSWDEPRGGFDAEVAKANLAGFICRREMSDTPNDEIAISADFAVCQERFNRHIGAGEDAFKLFIKDVEKELLEDLWSPQTRREIWAEAKSFEKEVFPAPKLTAALLRERRLGRLDESSASLSFHVFLAEGGGKRRNFRRYCKRNERP
jgi:hypothetical protein